MNNYNFQIAKKKNYKKLKKNYLQNFCSCLKIFGWSLELFRNLHKCLGNLGSVLKTTIISSYPQNASGLKINFFFRQPLGSFPKVGGHYDTHTHKKTIFTLTLSTLRLISSLILNSNELTRQTYPVVKRDEK